MPWVKLDDHFDQHPKLMDVGPLGLALWVAGLAYCNRNLTDGWIPWGAARSLLCWEFLGESKDGDDHRTIWRVAVSSGMRGEDVEPAFVISLLVNAGLWAEGEGGFRVHDYHEFQPSAEDVRKARESNAVRQSRHRIRSRNSVSNAVSNGPVTNTPYPKPLPEKIESESTPLASAGAEPVLELTSPETNGKADDDWTFEQCFATFYEEYPRKVKRPTALRAWKAINPQNQKVLDAIFAGMYRWADHWKDRGTEPDKIPYPATFLNGRQWEDQP